MKGREAYNSAMFAIALGVFMAVKALGYPILGVAALTPIMGLLWPYLTLRQNFFIGSMRFLLDLPGIWRGCVWGRMQAVLLLESMRETMKRVLVEMVNDLPRHRQGEALVTGEWLSKKLFEEWSGWFIYFVVAMTPVAQIIVFFVVPYLFYRFFRRRGLYKRLPWGFRD